MARDSHAGIGAEIIAKVMGCYRGGVAVRLWDGTLAHGSADASCTLVFNEPGALRGLILHRDLLRLTESYLAGAIDVEGGFESLFDLRGNLLELELPLRSRFRQFVQALRLPALVRNGSTRSLRASLLLRRNSRASIAHHYDVSNDFYRLWLDPEMVYSCAY